MSYVNVFFSLLLYLFLILLISPFINGLFSTLDEIEKKENYKILLVFELIIHTILIFVFIETLSEYYFNYFYKNIFSEDKTIKDIIKYFTYLIFIYNQKNLAFKLQKIVNLI